MLSSKDVEIFDGDYEIIYSGIFNVYEDKLVIKNIIPKTIFEFEFQSDADSIDQYRPVRVTPKGKKLHIKLFGFYQPLGIGTTKPIPIAKNKSKKQELFFSIHGKSLGKKSNFLQVGITFYLKRND